MGRMWIRGAAPGMHGSPIARPACWVAQNQGYSSPLLLGTFFRFPEYKGSGWQPGLVHLLAFFLSLPPFPSLVTYTEVKAATLAGVLHGPRTPH